MCTRGDRAPRCARLRPNLSGASLEYCQLRGAQVSGAIVDGARFRYADLEGTGIQGVTRGVASYSYCPGIEGAGGMEGGGEG